MIFINCSSFPTSTPQRKSEKIYGLRNIFTRFMQCFWSWAHCCRCECAQCHLIRCGYRLASLSNVDGIHCWCDIVRAAGYLLLLQQTVRSRWNKAKSNTVADDEPKKCRIYGVFVAFAGPLYAYVWTNQNELPANSIIYYIHWLESNARAGLMK